ncbi:MAG: ABC transporter substrate-binding protein [Candidatus Thermoplasmatota archaeon]|nr:ABC transporter substrate-binding protein [Candidatus Thermoplasmatota archaeon]
MNKAMAAFVVAMVAVASVAGAYVILGAGNQENGGENGNGNIDAAIREDFVLTDIRGRNVEIPGEIDRIIAIGAASLRMVSYFDSIEKIVAVDMQEISGSAMFGGRYFNSSTYRIAFPGLRDLPNIGGSSPINAEAIIAQNPNIVFSSATGIVDLDTMQETLGIPVVAINADLEMDNTDFYLQIALVGKVLDEEARAQELMDGLEGIMGDLANRTEGIVNQRSAYAAGMFFYGGGGLYKTSGDYLPFEFTGVKNVMPSNSAGVGKQPYNTDIETIMENNPEYVFIDSITENDCKDEYSEKKALLDGVSAFSNQKVYTTLVYKNYGTNWENQVVNMYYVGSVVYPELYQDLNIEDKAEEIWGLFFQVELDYEDVAALQNGPGLGAANWWI